MSIIARLGVWLGINTSEFVKGLDDATKKTREFEKNQKNELLLKIVKQMRQEVLPGLPLLH